MKFCRISQCRVDFISREFTLAEKQPFETGLNDRKADYFDLDAKFYDSFRM